MGNTSSKGPFSIAMLDCQGVTIQQIHEPPTKGKFGPPIFCSTSQKGDITRLQGRTQHTTKPANP